MRQMMINHWRWIRVVIAALITLYVLWSAFLQPAEALPRPRIVAATTCGGAMFDLALAAGGAVFGGTNPWGMGFSGLGLIVATHQAYDLCNVTPYFPAGGMAIG